MNTEHDLRFGERTPTTVPGETATTAADVVGEGEAAFHIYLKLG